MMQSDERMQSFLTDFFTAWLFKPLPDHLRGAIAAKLRLCSFQPGAVIYPPTELPSDVHFIVQGSVRILGADSQKNPTLGVLGPGTVIGWDSLIRRVGEGSVRAAMTPQVADREVLTLALAADEFESLALNYLMPVLMQQVSLLELFDTLSRALSHLLDPTSDLDLSEVVQSIDRGQFAVAQHWDAAMPEARSLTLSDDRIWLVSGGGGLNLPIGTPITHVNQLQQTRPSRFPVRLLGLDRVCLTSTLQQTPAILAPIEPSAPISAPDDKAYPAWKSRSLEPIEDIVACFGMVCERLQVPYRPDSMRRSLKQQSLDRFKPVDLYMRIAQAIGLNAQVINFTPTGGGINRLITPALIQFGDVFAVLYSVTPTMTVLGSPRTGLVRLTPDRLAERLTIESPSGSGAAACRAIVLDRLGVYADQAVWVPAVCAYGDQTARYFGAGSAGFDRHSTVEFGQSLISAAGSR